MFERLKLFSGSQCRRNQRGEEDVRSRSMFSASSFLVCMLHRFLLEINKVCAVVVQVTHLSWISVPQLQADPLLHLHVETRTESKEKTKWNKGKVKIKPGSVKRALTVGFLLLRLTDVN